MFSFLHLELTSRCNKSCWMCGRRKMEREYPELCDWGDMDYEMVEEIARQVPMGTVVQMHDNGEGLLYPRFGDAARLLYGRIRCLNTNGKLLLEKADEIIDNLETLTISVVQDDPEGDDQYENVLKFLARKQTRKPLLVYRCLGKVDNIERWKSLPGHLATRVLHSPRGSFDYQRQPTIPEIGICLDLLTHLAIDRYGNISLCVRFDPKGELRLGNIKETSLEEAWTSPKRRQYLEHHIRGDRKALPGCCRCEYFGVPTG